MAGRSSKRGPVYRELAYVSGVERQSLNLESAAKSFCYRGCWVSDPLNYWFGRRGTIFFSANFCLWPAIASAFARSWWELFICRIFLGIGMGSKGSTVPVFAAENSPAAIRGSLVMT